MHRRTDYNEYVIDYRPVLKPIKDKFQPYMLLETGEPTKHFSSDKARSAYLRMLREKDEFEEKQLK
jgi:hypothetical protein